MKRLMIVLCTILVAQTVWAEEVTLPSKKVFVSQVVEHRALDATTKGIVDALAKNGYKAGESIDLRVESAQASPVLAAQIASKYANQRPSIVVGVGTISAQSFAKYAQQDNLKLVFASVTDPVGAGLVKSFAKPGSNTSGVSNFVALEPQLRLFKEIQPNLKRLGILYNPGEANSVYIVNNLEAISAKFGIILVKQSVTKTADVAQAAAKLANQVDAIFVSNDNTTLSALQTVIASANSLHIPVYVSDTDAVQLGALAALGPNQYEVGLQAGNMIARALQGADLSAMPVELPQKTDLYLNLQAAKTLDIHVSNDLLLRAAVIIDKK